MSKIDDAKATMISNLNEKTGKPLSAWIKLIGEAGLEKHGDIMKLLKGEHGVTHGFANLIAHEARAAGETGDTDLVEAQYSGKKEALRPILDAVLKAVQTFGTDLEVAPKKTSVSLRRKKQFAVVSAATNTRVDIGVQLKGDAPTARLKAAGGMTSHKVGISSAKEVDQQLIGWLNEAYARAG